jgi:hypothetical protein
MQDEAVATLRTETVIDCFVASNYSELFSFQLNCTIFDQFGQKKVTVHQLICKLF